MGEGYGSALITINQPLRIFISYARSDDQPPVEGEGRGFVTTLVKYLEYRLVELGTPPEVDIWRDQRAIVPSEQFGPAIEAGLNAADVLVVIFSNNWLSSKWCRKELDFFAARFSNEEVLKQRIVLVNKRWVDRIARPSALQGQEGYKFFRPDKDVPGGFFEYFALGKSYLPEFATAIAAIADDLWKRACKKENLDAPASAQTPAAAPQAPRKIFVARPAPDMRTQYNRIVEELQNREYAVVPNPSAEIPLDATAQAFFDDALSDAEAALHLLGEKLGFRPDDDLPPVAKLQLQRSALRAKEDPRFRRLIWAPAQLDGHAGRDPLAVLRTFDEKIEGDKVDGSDLSSFVDFMVRHLHDNAPAPAARRALPADARVYIYHQREDTAYAMAVARALRERDLGVSFPIFQGDAVKLHDWHESQLKNCDAILVCWANADEAFTFSTLDECSDWRLLGRRSEFSSRVVVVGPPRNERKEVLIEFPPRPEVDVVIDLTAVDRPTPGELGAFLNATPS